VDTFLEYSIGCMQKLGG